MILSLFDHSNAMRDAFRAKGYEALSLDIQKPDKKNPQDLHMDIMNFNYKAFHHSTVSFLFIALPCQVYSIASGGYHFKLSIPKTKKAIKHIQILIRIYQITRHFNCDFIIENPAGGLINNKIFQSFFNLDVTRLTLKSFGFVTQKKTDLFSNFNLLVLNNPVTRVNGKYQKQKLDNLGYRARVLYPQSFVDTIVHSVIKQSNTLCKWPN
jgi:hypothetical protein